MKLGGLILLVELGARIAQKYVLKELLGAGACGQVYRAHYEAIGSVCAIKIMPLNTSVREWFQREAKAANRVQVTGDPHPNVIRIYDAGEDAENKCFFLVMDLLNGKTLERFVHSRPGHKLAMEDFRAIFLPIIDAMAVAHECGIVHRDLKPDNVFVIKHADRPPWPVVLDFGIAQMADMRMTVTGWTLGTPAYLAPELWGGHANRADGASDVFALGVMLHQALSGSNPFWSGHETVEQLGERVLRETPPVLPVDARLNAAIQKALAKSPGDRFQNAGQLLAAVRASLEDPPSAAASPTDQNKQLPPAIVREAYRHAIMTYPESCVGFLVGPPTRAGERVTIDDTSQLGVLRDEKQLAVLARGRSVSTSLRQRSNAFRLAPPGSELRAHRSAG